MVVAVTGATGFLGAHTVAALHRWGHRVRAMVRPGAHRDGIAEFVHEWRSGGLGDPRALARLVDGAGAVVHLAMDWRALGKGPIANLEGNLVPAVRLLETARGRGVGQLLYVSTLEVYRETVPNRALDEGHPTWPDSLYGAVKAAVEVHLKAYHHAHGMNVSAWRPATMIGVNPRLERSHWYEPVGRVVRGARSPEAPADSDVVAVEDVAEALVLALGDPVVAGELYNLVDIRVPGAALAAMARALAAGETLAEAPALPRSAFDNRKARSFFERHGRPDALRRGRPGVERYLRDLMRRIDGP